MLRRTMAESKMTARQAEFPRLRSVERIVRIPFVESGWTVATNIYAKIKTSNPLFNWGLDQAEFSVFLVLNSTKPAVNLFNKPITMIDSILCKSLDLVEEKVPVVTLPPELIYVSTKDYVSHSLVQPVLKRADSVKQFGMQRANTVLASRYTNFAADRLDTALTVADKFVDQYLPADAADVSRPEHRDYTPTDSANHSKAAQTMRHVDVFSRKLRRRLTRRTIAEARAFKRQSVDAFTFMINMAELLAKDPKAAMDKAATLWAHLSEDEPENQARPQNLEQLTVMVGRETARRVVHLVNYASSRLASLPTEVRTSVERTAAALVALAEAVVKKTHLEGVTDLALTTTLNQATKLRAVIENFNSLAVQILELVAATIAGKHRGGQQSNGSANSHHEQPRQQQHQANNVLHNSFE